MHQAGGAWCSRAGDGAGVNYLSQTDRLRQRLFSALAHALRYSLNNADRTVCRSVGEDSMQDEKQKKEELLEVLRAEVARLLCADDVSEEEKLSRIQLAQAIIESEEV